MATNPFDQFDEPATPSKVNSSANPFDQFDEPSETNLDRAKQLARKELEIGYEMSKDSPYDFSGERTLGGTATEIAKAFPREAAAGALQSIEGLKEYSQYLPAARVATSAVEKGLGFLGFEPGKEGEDSPFRKARDYLREDSFLRGDDKYQDVWTVKLGGGAGSTMPFLLSRYFLGPIGLRATAFGSGAGEQADRIKQAREAGVDVSELEEFGGLTLGGAIGLSETYLPERLVKTLKSVPKSIPIGEKTRILSMVKRGLSATPEIIKTGGKEGAQEVFSSIAQTLVEMGYNPEAELPSGQSLWDDFSVGFVVGAGADAIANGVAARRVNAVSDIDLEREREARQAEDANNFMLGQQLRDQAEQRAMMESDPLAFERQTLAARQGASQVAMPSLEEVSQYVSPSVTSKDPAPASMGELYAMRIIGSLRNYFPSQASFTVEQDGDGFRVVDESGIQYGQRMGDKRVASSVASNLNKEISNKGIRGSILDTLMTSPDSYSPQDADALFRYGFRTLSPEANRVSFGALNEAAGTTTEKGFVEDLPLDLLAGAKKLRDGRYSIQMPDGSTQYIAGLTASQKLNLERTQNGLPPATTFDIKEARQFLNGNLGALSQPAISGIQDNAEYGGTLDEDGKPVVMSSAGEVLTGRVVTEAEKLRAGQDEDGNDILPDYIEFKTLDEAKRYAGRLNQRGQGSRFLPAEVLRGKKDLKPDIKRLLAAKNIASEPDSEEVGQLVKSFTGADSFADMSLDDQKLFYARVRELPALSKPSKIPVFKSRSMTTEEIGRREIEQKQEKRLREEERQGVEAFPVEFELVKDIARLGIPLEMFKVKTRITDREGNDITDQTEGYFDPALEELALAIDSIDPEGKLTQEERVYKLRDVLTHETMHALRAMDLFTQKEWSLLESAVARTKRKPGPDDKEQRDETYLQRARRMYPDESPLVQVEEAIAELARDYIGNRKLIGGKPKSLLERLIRFLTKLRNFVDGKGFNSFSDVLRAVETGRVGRRKRGEVRSLRTTEARQFDLYGAVPARYAPFIDEFDGAPVVAPPSPLPTFVQTQPTQGAGPTTDFDLSALEGADVRYSRKDVVYAIVDNTTGKEVGYAKTRDGARRVMDRRDNAVGGYRHSIVPLNEDVAEQQRLEKLSKLGGRRYSVKDISKLTDSRGSLKTFSEQFSDRIKQADRTLEDADRIAKGYIKEFVENPSAFLPVVTGDKLDVNTFLRMPDGTMYDPNKLEHANATDQTIQIYNAIQNGTIGGLLQREAQALNQQRAEDLSNLAAYLNENADYSLAEQAVIMKGASKYGVRAEKDKGLKLVPIEDNNRTSVAVLTATEASAVAEELRKGKSLKDAMLDGMKNAVESMKKSNKSDAFTGWKTFKKSDSEEDAAALKDGCAGRAWCTASATSTARSQLSQGDFHVYYKNGEPIVALRTVNGKLAEPPRGSLPSQFMTAEEEKIAEEALRAGRVEGGEDYIHDRDLINDVISGRHKDWPDIELFTKRKRKYPVGYGAKKHDLPELVLEAIEDERLSRNTERQWEKLGYFVGNAFIQEGQNANIKYVGGNLAVDNKAHSGDSAFEKTISSIVNFDPIHELKVRGIFGGKKSTVVVEYVQGSAFVNARNTTVAIDYCEDYVDTAGESEVFVGKAKLVSAANNSFMRVGETEKAESSGNAVIEITSEKIVKGIISNNKSTIIAKNVDVAESRQNSKIKVQNVSRALVEGSSIMYAGNVNRRITVASLYSHDANGIAYIGTLGEEAFLNLGSGYHSIFINEMNGAITEHDSEGVKKLYVKKFKKNAYLKKAGELFSERIDGNLYANGTWDAVVLDVEKSANARENSAIVAKAVKQEIFVSGDSAVNAGYVGGIIFQQGDGKAVVDSHEVNKRVIADDKGKVTIGQGNAIKAELPPEYFDGMSKIKSAFPETERRYSRKDLPATIEVDGVQRPRVNSEGRPIEVNDESLRNFWRWFRDSKVVASGAPEVVYRGESGGKHYDKFDRRMTDAGVGFFFATDKQQAESYDPRRIGVREFYLKSDNLLDLTNPYSAQSRKFINEYAQEFEDWTDRYSGEPTDPFKLLESGLIYDYEGTGSGRRWNALFSLAESLGFDGVKVLDATDGAGAGVAPVYVVFEPTQIKSATENVGTYDKTNPDIRYSRKDEVRNPNLVQRSPEVLQEAVQKVEKDIKDTGRFAVPLYSQDASPDAMYVAMNPDFGQKLSDDEKRRYSRKNTPQFGQKAKDIMDRVTPEMPDETLGETILKKMELPPVRDMADKFRKNFVNRYARLERQYRENPELKALLADVSSMAMTEMADHSRQFTQRALVYGVPVYEKGMVKVKDFIHKGKKYRGLIEVMAMLHSKEHGNLEPLAHAYATAVRGERLNKEGKLSPVKPGELKVLEEEVNKFINPATGQPIIKEWFETWQSYNSNIVKFLKDTGVIDDAGAELWLKQSDYVPFYRENAEGNLEFPRVFGGLHTAGQFKAVGKSDKALNVDMITAITGNIDAAIAMGMKNVAQQRIIRDQMKLGLASLLKPGEAVGNRNSVSFKVAGKRYTAIIDDPLIYESMLPVSEIQLDGLFGSFLRIPASWLRELIIREPGYMVANMFRDTLSSYVITGAEITPLVDTARNMFADLTDLENLGVVGGYDLRIDRDSVKKFYEKNSKLMGMKGGVNWKNPIMAAWDGLGRLSTRSEAATRLAVYNDILARTGNEAEAQYQALSVMNYGRRGGNPMFRALTAIVPFMNARVQGLDKLWQATFGRIGAKYETDAQGNVTRNLNNFKNFQRYFIRAGYIVGMSALYYALMHDDDEYKNATPEVRDNYYIIPIQKGNVAAGEPGLAVRLPIPFEVGILFKVIPERFLAATFGEDTPRDMTESFWRNLKSTLAMNPIPQTFLPLVEVGFNKDTYTGRPIVPTYMENLLPEQQTTFYTNKFVEDIANMMGFSPMKVDHLAQGYGGSLGAYLLQAVDSAWRSGGEKKPALAWYQYPVMKRFFATANQPGLQSQFYDLKDYMDGITKTINDLEERGQYDDLAAFYAKNGHIYEMRSTVNYMNRYITRLRDQRKMVEQMDIDPESKREMIEQINMQIAASLTTVPMLRQEAFGPRPENEE